MLQFLQSYGFELILVLYGIISTIVNVLTFRRTGSTNKIIKGGVPDESSAPQDKLVKKIQKAREKLEKLIEEFEPKDGV